MRRKLFGVHFESIVQDVDVTVQHAPAFLDFFQREIGLTPVWICPFSAYDRQHRFPLFPTDPKALYINFGFWDSKVSPTWFPDCHFNRLIEHKLAELGGIKSLYSDSYFTPEEFSQVYNKPDYDRLKAKYDPQHWLSDLYQKCVLRRWEIARAVK
jgi:FAD/FMN-containing dehydrogenase